MTLHATRCPLCREEIVRQHIEWLSEATRLQTEMEIVKHLRDRHARRYGLWLMFGRRTRRPFRWLLGVW